MTKSDRTRKLRRKPAALMSMQFCEVCEELYAIRDCCADIHWWMDTDEEVLLGALDGDAEDAWEFRMAFTDLECKTEALLECLSGWEAPTEAVWDDCTVGLLGRRYQVVGFDDVEEDYVALSSWGAQYPSGRASQAARARRGQVPQAGADCPGGVPACGVLRLPTRAGDHPRAGACQGGDRAWMLRRSARPSTV